MAKPAQSRININLLTQDEFSQSMIGKFLLWALSIGRYVVVITELIVIISFLSRFKLDRDLTDTNEAIERQKAVIQSYGTLEQEFKNYQHQLEFINEETPIVYTHEVLSMLESSLPFDVKVTNVSTSKDTASIKAVALSLPSFGQFLNTLLTQPAVASVSLGQVSAEEQGNIVEFDVQIAFKEI
jgi:Tfp pilus assembly protein PilN